MTPSLDGSLTEAKEAPPHKVPSSGATSDCGGTLDKPYSIEKKH